MSYLILFFPQMAIEPTIFTFTVRQYGCVILTSNLIQPSFTLYFYQGSRRERSNKRCGPRTPPSPRPLSPTSSNMLSFWASHALYVNFLQYLQFCVFKSEIDQGLLLTILPLLLHIFFYHFFYYSFSRRTQTI